MAGCSILQPIGRVLKSLALLGKIGMIHEIDAKGKPLGRLASEIAVILQGKKSPSYAPNRVSGDKVRLRNYAQFAITGKKMTGKLYHHHTGYMGHLKTKTLAQVYEKDPKRVVREAVRKMLPKNFLNQRRLNNLTFVESE